MKHQPPEPLPKVRTRRTYTKEFKQEAVRLATQISARQAAADLGIDATMLRSWVRLLSADGTDAFRGRGNRTAMDAEMTRMRREIAELRQEREILKKAAEFWVKECS